MEELYPEKKIRIRQFMDEKFANRLNCARTKAISNKRLSIAFLNE